MMTWKCWLIQLTFDRRWYRTGWWLEHRVRDTDGHYTVPRPEVYVCPKCGGNMSNKQRIAGWAVFLGELALIGAAAYLIDKYWL